MLMVTFAFGQYSTTGFNRVHPAQQIQASISMNGSGILQTNGTQVSTRNTFGDLNYLHYDAIFNSDGSFLNDDKCARFTKMRKAGTVLVIVGPIGLGVGILSIIMGAINDQPGVIYGGGALCTIGSVALGAGIPLKIIGNKKSRQYCGDSNSSILELNTSGNGIALNYRF